MQYKKYIVATLLLYVGNCYGAAQSAAAVAAGAKPPLPIKPRLSVETMQVAAAAGLHGAQELIDQKKRDEKRAALLAKVEKEAGSRSEFTSTTFTVRNANREIPKVTAHIHFITRTCVEAKPSNSLNLQSIVRRLDRMHEGAQNAMKDAQAKKQHLSQLHGAAAQSVSSPDSSPDEVALPEAFSSLDMCNYVELKDKQIQRFRDSLEQGSSYATMESLGTFIDLLQKLTTVIPTAKAQLEIAIDNAKKKDAAKKKAQAVASGMAAASVGTTSTPSNTPQADAKVAAASALKVAPPLPPLPKRPSTSSSASASASSLSAKK